MNRDYDIETRQERREKKLRKKQEQIRKHSKDLAKIYRNAILKRMKDGRK